VFLKKLCCSLISSVQYSHTGEAVLNARADRDFS